MRLDSTYSLLVVPPIYFSSVTGGSVFVLDVLREVENLEKIFQRERKPTAEHRCWNRFGSRKGGR